MSNRDKFADRGQVNFSGNRGGERLFNYNPENRRHAKHQDGRDPKVLERFFKDPDHHYETVHQDLGEDEEFHVSRVFKKPMTDI